MLKTNHLVIATIVAMGLWACAEKGKSTKPKAAKKISKATAQKVSAAQPAVEKTSAKPASRPSSRPANSQLPPGHPPAANKGLPPGHPPAANKGLPPGHPPSTGSANPAGAAPHGGSIQNVQAPGVIKGRIELTEELRSRVKPGTTLFVSVRRFAGPNQRGMIMAAKKIPVGGASQFPLDFTVTQRDVMMGNTRLAGPVTLSARIDQDGDAISKQAGDIEGEHKGALEVGKGRATILLNALRQ